MAMTFQPRVRSPGEFGRRSGKVRGKAKSERRRLGGEHRLVEEHVPTVKEVVERTLNGLQHLGSQRFPVAPYYDHFDRWLLSLRTTLSDFESNQGVTLDEQFTKERSRILSDIEAALKERRLAELSREETIRRINQKIIEARSTLAQIDREYAAKTKEIMKQREGAVKPVASRVASIRRDLDRIAKMRAGFLRAISKRAKVQKTSEATQRLESTKGELTRIEQSYAAEQEKLEKERRKKRRQIQQETASYEKEIASLDESAHFDDAVDPRRIACDALTNEVNAVLQRNTIGSESTNSQE
jgi:chromosome segregation ATPase